MNRRWLCIYSKAFRNLKILPPVKNKYALELGAERFSRTWWFRIDLGVSNDSSALTHSLSQ